MRLSSGGRGAIVGVLLLVLPAGLAGCTASGGTRARPPRPGQARRGTSTPRPAVWYSSTPNGQGHTMATVTDTALDPP